MFEPLQYFEFSEFVSSETALLKKIPNFPTWEQINRIYEVASILDQVRKEWGKPIFVTSGFRCEELNCWLNGVKNSAHLSGWAVDLQTENLDEFYKFFEKWLNEHGVLFDELIWETKGSSKWIHFALFSIDGKQRRKKLSLNVK